MLEQKILNCHKIPIDKNNRRSTDLFCTIFGAIFAITMFVVACCMWDKQNFTNKIAIHEQGYKIYQKCQNRYFIWDNSEVSQQIQCVKQCPQNFYNYQQACILQQNKQKILGNSEMTAFIQSKQVNFVFLLVFAISICFGILYSLFTHLMRKMAPIITYICATIIMLILGTIILIFQSELQTILSNTNMWVKIGLSIFCFMLCLIITVMACMYANSLKVQALFVDYAVRYLNYNKSTALYIPIFISFTFGLIALIVWQQCCFFSSMPLTYIPFPQGYFSLQNLNLWGILNILEFIWGIQFLKDSFNFCVSGHASDWYYSKNTKSNCYGSFIRLVCKNWGSVVAGSFINAFLQIPVLIAQLIICHPNTCCNSAGTLMSSKFSGLMNVLNLVRADSYCYMNISGLDYCKSSNECKKICKNSIHFVGQHSPIKHYRFVSHVLCVSLLFIICCMIGNRRLIDFNFSIIALMLTLINIAVTWFINIHADVAEGLLISFLVENYLQPDYHFIQYLHPAYRDDLQHWERRIKRDGQC